MEKQFLSILPQEKNVLEMRMKKITNKSKAFLQTLIQQLRNASEKARTTVFDYKLFNVPNRALQQIDELHYYPEDIRKIIFSKQHIAVVISFNIHGRDYHLYLFYPIVSIPKATQIQEEIRKIYTWLDVVHEHANEGC